MLIWSGIVGNVDVNNMVALLSREDRFALGINNYPRSIVWSAMMLLRANKVINQSPTYPGAIRFGANKTTIFIEATLPYDRNVFITTGGDVISAIIPITGLSPYNDLLPIPPAEPVFLELPNSDDSRLDSLEKFLVWCCMRYKVGLNRFTNLDDAISVLFFDEQETGGYPTLGVKASLPYSYTTYCCTGSIVRAVYELFIDNPCGSGVLSIDGRVILFKGNVLVDLGLIP
jgi:hypothetical protein